MQCTLILSFVALSSAGFLDKEAAEGSDVQRDDTEQSGVSVTANSGFTKAAEEKEVLWTQDHDADTQAALRASDIVGTLSPGTRVTIVGLKGAKSLNGLPAEVVNFDEKLKKYHVDTLTTPSKRIPLNPKNIEFTKDYSNESLFLPNHDTKKKGFNDAATAPLSTAALAMKSSLESELAHYMTKEGKLEHQEAMHLAGLNHGDLLEAAEDLLINAQKREGWLPKGLPDFPKDPTERLKFTKALPVSPDIYAAMLTIKKDPNHYLKVLGNKYKGVLSSLIKERAEGSKVPESQMKAEEVKVKSIDIIKASPKEFKMAYKAWEKMLPQAASLLLQFGSPGENPQAAQHSLTEAQDLAKKAQGIHQDIVASIALAEEHFSEYPVPLMSVAQNRITSLMIRQAEASLENFDALDGCTGPTKDYEGAESRCLCVVDNICSRVGHSQGGGYCSIVSTATCMSPKDEMEADLMSTV